MKIPFTPFVRGLDRSIADTAQSIGGLRDVLNLLPEATGRLDGIFRNPVAKTLSTNSATRWLQWGDSTVICKTNPSGNVQVTTDALSYSGPTETATAATYRTVCMTTGAQAYAMTNKSNPFIDRVYLCKDSGTGWGDCTLSGSGTITVTFNNAERRPLNTAGATPQYIIFDADTAEGSTTAKIRACINPTYVGAATTDMTSIQYVGATVTGVTRAYIVYGDSSTDTFSPTCFSTWRNRLCAGTDTNEVYFAGFIGQASPFVAPDQNDWGYWYELNSVKVGHSGQGEIVRMEPLGDDLIVFLENATYRLYGQPPVNGAYDNQIVVQEINPTLGVNSYDSVGRAPDGNLLFVAANDGQCYAFSGQYTLISEPLRLHSRFVNIDAVQVSEHYAVFTGTQSTPENVPYESDPKDGGLLYQSQPAFLYSIAKQVWTMLDQWATTDNLTLTPISDPHERGIFGAFRVNDLYELAISEPDGIHIINDKSVDTPQLNDTFICGLATHQIPVSPQFRGDKLTILAETPYVTRISGALPAENPSGTAPMKQMRDKEAARFGQTSKYALHNSSPDAHNFASCAIGYWGERLINGMDYWTASTAITIDATPTVMQFTNSGAKHINRIDVLLSGFTDCRLTLYEDNAGAVGDVIFYADCVTPQNGSVNTATPYWRSFGINVPVTATYWVGLTGTCIAYRYPSNGDVSKSGSVIHAGNSIVLRAVEEAGGCYSAKSILELSATGQPLPYDY